jgi:hypothetical protein
LDGSTENVLVRTVSGQQDLPKATCTLSNNKGTWIVVTPTAVDIHRSYDPLNILCNMPGYASNGGSVPSNTKGLVYGNAVFGGALGAAIDMGNGDAYDYPTPIIVHLHPLNELTPQAAAAP